MAPPNNSRLGIGDQGLGSDQRGEEVTGGMMHSVKRRLGNTRGQSILEYLVITTVVVLAILGIRAMVQTQTVGLFNEAGNKVGEATTQLGTFAVTAR